MRKLRENWLTPIVTGFLATVLGGLALLLLKSDETQRSRVTSATIQGELKFPHPPQNEWESLTNEEPYARNYSRREKRPFDLYEQVVTIYENPMTTDRKNGQQIASGEYLEIFKVGNLNDIVIQLRLDKGHYWLLSRQRVKLMDYPYLATYNPEQDDATFKRFQIALQNIIDATRHFLKTQL